MKSYTDIEQSRKLAEILSPESADMYYSYYHNPISGASYYEEYPIFHIPINKNKSLPCWSLAALLEIIKKLVGYSLQSLNSHTVFMSCELGDKPYTLKTNYYNNAIDAAYEMIIKLHELNLL